VIRGMTDEKAAELIRQDRIDILVDLAMHMGYNRLTLFARKPAPVQVTYLAYTSGTGIAAMDYRLTDAFIDPPAKDSPGDDSPAGDSPAIDGFPAKGALPGDRDLLYSEKSIRLPGCYWCYQANPHAGDVTALPALAAGRITFASLNNFAKVSDDALSAWAWLLGQIPGSKLILHANEGSHRRRVLDVLKAAAIEAGRIDFVGRIPTAEYFKLYESVDIALDPFPYAGGTTTCDALWMGVPVVSLAGHTGVGRGGLTILSNIGLPDLVADTIDGYVAIAVRLADNLPCLAELRAGLRQRMSRSVLMDGRKFTRNIESAYRQMWRTWCQTRSKSPTARSDSA
jgi:predicted O-linked N-acetylglucosamine transferase (SPINDLY family)